MLIEDNKLFISIENMYIPVLSLSCEYEEYNKLGRIEKSELILKRLKYNHNKEM